MFYVLFCFLIIDCLLFFVLLLFVLCCMYLFVICFMCLHIVYVYYVFVTFYVFMRLLCVFIFCVCLLNKKKMTKNLKNESYSSPAFPTLEDPQTSRKTMVVGDNVSRTNVSGSRLGTIQSVRHKFRAEIFLQVYRTGFKAAKTLNSVVKP